MPTYSLDEPEFERAVRASYSEWFAFARRLTADDATSADLVQTDLTKIVQRLRTAPLVLDGPLRAYVYESVRKEFYGQWKRAQRKKSIPFSVELLIAACDERRGEIFGPGLLELIEILQGEVGTRQMTVLVMHDVLGFTYREIAAMTAIGNASTVHSKAAKARGVLRSRLGQLGFALDIGDLGSTGEGS